MGTRHSPIIVLLAALGSGGLVVPPGTSAPIRFATLRRRPSATLVSPSPVAPGVGVVEPIEPIDIQILQSQLQAVRELPRYLYSSSGSDSPTPFYFDPRTLRYDEKHREPSFRRLFTHDTWKRYTGRPAHQRWTSSLAAWPSIQAA